MRKVNRRSSFQGGFGRASVYACRCCKRQTRGAGDAFGVELCGECFELAGIENAISDNGEEVVGTYYDEARASLAKLAKLGADLSNWQDLISILDAFDKKSLSISKWDNVPAVTVATAQGLKVDIMFDRIADVCWSCDIRGDRHESRSLAGLMSVIADYIGRTEF